MCIRDSNEVELVFLGESNPHLATISGELAEVFAFDAGGGGLSGIDLPVSSVRVQRIGVVVGRGLSRVSELPNIDTACGSRGDAGNVMESSSSFEDFEVLEVGIGVHRLPNDPLHFPDLDSTQVLSRGHGLDEVLFLLGIGEVVMRVDHLLRVEAH